MIANLHLISSLLLRKIVARNQLNNKTLRKQLLHYQQEDLSQMKYSNNGLNLPMEEECIV